MANVQETPIQKLRPTQITVGLIEVRDKVERLSPLPAKGRRELMRGHPIPAVLGPEGKLYITDHHHLGRAAIEVGLTTAFCELDADLSTLAGDEFWKEMNRRAWVHPLDENGVRHHYSSIPDCLEKMVDDVYRSLAGYVRAARGFDKSPTAFAEFVWANFFRRLIAIEDVRADFRAAVKTALALAQGKSAKGLPGYTGK